jgi:hypothetical protein
LITSAEEMNYKLKNYIALEMMKKEPFFDPIFPIFGNIYNHQLLCAMFRKKLLISYFRVWVSVFIFRISFFRFYVSDIMLRNECFGFHDFDFMVLMSWFRFHGSDFMILHDFSIVILGYHRKSCNKVFLEYIQFADCNKPFL